MALMGLIYRKAGTYCDFYVATTIQICATIILQVQIYISWTFKAGNCFPKKCLTFSALWANDRSSFGTEELSLVAKQKLLEAETPAM